MTIEKQSHFQEEDINKKNAKRQSVPQFSPPRPRYSYKRILENPWNRAQGETYGRNVDVNRFQNWRVNTSGSPDLRKGACNVQAIEQPFTPDSINCREVHPTGPKRGSEAPRKCPTPYVPEEHERGKWKAQCRKTKSSIAMDNQYKHRAVPPVNDMSTLFANCGTGEFGRLDELKSEQDMILVDVDDAHGNTVPERDSCRRLIFLNVTEDVSGLERYRPLVPTVGDA